MATINIDPTCHVYEPLSRIRVRTASAGQTIRALDGAGACYFTGTADAEGGCDLFIGGALGTHTILLQDVEKLMATATFRVDVQTSIRDGRNEMAPFLRDLQFTLTEYGGGTVKVNGKIYRYLVCWLRDHTHTMKGRKYFPAELKTGLELYADTQRADGMIYDLISRKQYDVQIWRDHTFAPGDFIRTVYSEPGSSGIPYSMQRIPVETDVEYLFIECLYCTWKATGDTGWMTRYLDHAVKALRYAVTDPYRWSRKFDLPRRGYTIDTWDFMHEADTALTSGDNVCDLQKTIFGVMFGDSTGLAAGCRQLAEMLRAAGRGAEAPAFEQMAAELMERLNRIAWNGRFYTHHVSENPSFRRDVGGTDESSQITLSNAYSINRGIGADKARAILRTYQQIRRDMPGDCTGEFFMCYPPFEKGFDKQSPPWQYMNGGVSPIAAGELARGAFHFGEEGYGVDILRRVKALADRHGGYLHCCFNGRPQVHPPERRCVPLDLAGAAQVTPAWRDSAGWGDPGNDLSRLPRGKQVLCGVPFCIGAEGIGLAHDRKGFGREVRVPVHGRYASLYLLHAMTGSQLAVAEMEICYEDGESRFVQIEKGGQTESWFLPESDEIRSNYYPLPCQKGWPPYQLAWRGKNDKFSNVGVWVWGWDNARPEVEIRELVFRAARNGNAYFIPAITGSDHSAWFPQRNVSYGIPDPWGAAAMVYALVEGLAGVVDTGVAFDRAEISPRWNFAGETRAEVAVRYGESDGYAVYEWRKTADGQFLRLTSSACHLTVRLPLDGSGMPRVTVQGTPAAVQIETIGTSRYAVLELTGPGVFDIHQG